MVLGLLGTTPGPEDTIVLGTALPLTGPNASIGLHMRDGYAFAVHKINEKGGVKVGGRTYRLDLRYYDDRSAPAQVLDLVERLIERDGIDFLLGPYGSATTMAILPLVEKYQVPIVEAGGEERGVFANGYRYHFGILSTADQCLVPVIRYAARHAAKLGKTKESLKIAIAMQRDSFAQNVRAGVLEEIRRHGMRIVIDDQLPDEVDDLSATLRRVEMLRPDILLISGGEKGALSAVRQIRSMRIEVPIVAATHCDTAKLAETLKEAAEGVFCTSQWHRSLGFKDALFGAAEDFAQEFEESYRYDVTHHAAQSSAAVYVFADAFNRAQSLDKAAVRDALAKTKLQTFYGPIEFDASGRNMAKTMVLTRIEGGKYVIVPAAEWTVGETAVPSSKRD